MAAITQMSIKRTTTVMLVSRLKIVTPKPKPLESVSFFL